MVPLTLTLAEARLLARVTPGKFIGLWNNVRAVAEARTELLFKMEAGRGERREQVFVNDVTWRLRRTPGGWKIVEEIWQ